MMDGLLFLAILAIACSFALAAISYIIVYFVKDRKTALTAAAIAFVLPIVSYFYLTI